jgi:putative phage-type endonuclease
MKILDLEQNSPEWEEFRQSHVGASDIGVLMEGSEKEIHDLLQEKRGLSKKFVTDAMQRGTNMEAEAIEWISGEKHDLKYKVCALHNKPDDWLMASFDYLDKKQSTLVEVKCPKVVLDKPTEHSHYKRWWWQVQAQLAVCGLKQGRILVYSPSKQMQEWIDRDEDAIEQLKEKGRWFYKIMVNFEDLPKSPEVTLREDDDTIQWARTFREIDEKIKELEEHKKVLRDEGIAIAGEDPFVCEGVKVLKIASRESVDYEAACRAHKIDVSTFRKIPKTPFTWRVSAS